MMMIPKGKWIAGMVLCATLLSVTPVAAFSDVQGQDAKIVQALQDRGVIQGVTKDKFAPRGKLSAAEALHMLVQALDLKANTTSYMAKGKPWYAESVQIAADNGIKLPDAVKPLSTLNREQFTYLADRAIRATGDYPMIKIYINIPDEKEITPGYQGAIQRMLVLKIAAFDQDGNFNPKESMTRMEAARMVYNAVQLVERHKQDNPVEEEVTYSTEKLNDGNQKVTLTRHQQPHPGYGIKVAKVEYSGNTAILYYELLAPDPKGQYPQVITDTKTQITIPDKYDIKIVAQ